VLCPDSAGGAYSAPPDSLAVIIGLLLRGREKIRRKEGKGREGKGRECPPHFANSLICRDCQVPPKIHH